MDIQAAIDALPSIGGKVIIPSGVHSGAPLRLRSNVILQGQGMSTVIPTIEGASFRIYGCWLRDLIVDTMETTGTPGYTIDWRNVTNGGFRHVLARGGNYGLVGCGSMYYNNFDHLFIDATTIAVDLSENANQNMFNGGKWTAPLMLRESGDVNGNTLVGTSLESALPGSQVQFYQRIPSANPHPGENARGVNVREECAGYGPYWVNGPMG